MCVLRVDLPTKRGKKERDLIEALRGKSDLLVGSMVSDKALLVI